MFALLSIWLVAAWVNPDPALVPVQGEWNGSRRFIIPICTH
jgi:hypothetical protein